MRNAALVHSTSKVNTKLFELKGKRKGPGDGRGVTGEKKHSAAEMVNVASMAGQKGTMNTRRG